MDETTKLVIATAMRNMLNGGHISICTIRECLQLAGITPKGRSYDLLSTLHCVKFKDMPAELADQMPRLLHEVFNGIEIDQLVRAAEPAEKRNGATALLAWTRP